MMLGIINIKICCIFKLADFVDNNYAFIVQLRPVSDIEHQQAHQN